MAQFQSVEGIKQGEYLSKVSDLIHPTTIPFMKFLIDSVSTSAEKRVLISSLALNKSITIRGHKKILKIH